MNRRGFLAALGGMAIEQVIPRRVWSFPSKIVIPERKALPRLLVSNGQGWVEIPGLSKIDYTPARSCFTEITNLYSPTYFREWMTTLESPDSVTFEGQVIGGLLLDKISKVNRFQLELADGSSFDGDLLIHEVQEAVRTGNYRIKADVRGIDSFSQACPRP